MRFVLYASFIALLSSESVAAPWDKVPLAQDAAQIAAPQKIRLQRGGTPDSLETLDSLTLTTAATGLGEISALTIRDNGTLLAADKKSGRIWSLPDRNKDGKIDLRRPLSHSFDAPTGLTAYEDKIYVADKNAIWVIEGQTAPRQLASLQNAKSSGGPHPLLINADGTKLTLGLTTRDRGFKVLELDTSSGQAILSGEGNYGQLNSLAMRGNSIWASSGETLGPLGDDVTSLAKGQSISALLLPGQSEKPERWPAQLKDMIIASHTGPNAMQLIAIPTEFGGISAVPHILLEGFTTRTGRNAWGQPGPIAMDERGLFFADSFNGTLYRLTPKATPQPKITIVDTDNLPKDLQSEPTLAAKRFGIESTIQGTQIDTKSTIKTPSSIIYGSQLIKDYDEKKAAEEAAKAEAEPEKKKRRMSRKRKQEGE